MGDVAYEVEVNRGAPSSDSIEGLDGAIRAVVTTHFAGVARRPKQPDKLFLLFEAGVTADQQNAAVQIAMAHDFNLRSARQVKETAQKGDLQDIIGDKADAILGQIVTLLDEIDADISALSGADAQGRVQIQQRTLQRQRQQAVLIRRVVKGMQLIARRALE